MKTRIIPAISVSLRPSYLILGSYVCISILSVIALMLATLSWMLQSAIIFVVIIATIYTVLQDVLLLLPWSWHQIEVSSHGQLQLTMKNGETFHVVLQPSSINHPWLTILHFKRVVIGVGFRVNVVLTPWQVADLQQYRKLRVWLKWGSPLKQHHTLDTLPDD
ncbi:MAG: hypothetical protein Q8R74_01570 [Methylophilus sp.]|nr:hypothetical protein [Methylophilus sp.]